MTTFSEVEAKKLNLPNPFTMIGDQWALVTAGDQAGYNTMTVSWGGLGVLWGKNVATIYIRPQRHTLSFLDRSDRFTLSFFDSSHRQALAFCGSKSGRDCDKAKETGLTPVFSCGSVYFDQAETVLVCRKLYKQAFDPACFIDSSIAENYAAKDYHFAFIGEIEKALLRA